VPGNVQNIPGNVSGCVCTVDVCSIVVLVSSQTEQTNHMDDLWKGEIQNLFVSGLYGSEAYP
jgi:hypothetical protein